MKNDAATVRPVRLRVGIRWAGVRKSSFFSRNMINFVLKLTNFVLKLMGVVLKMTDCVLKMTDFTQKCEGGSGVEVGTRAIEIRPGKQFCIKSDEFSINYDEHFVLKMMNIFITNDEFRKDRSSARRILVLKMMNFALKVMNSVFKMMDFVLKMMIGGVTAPSPPRERRRRAISKKL